MSHMRKSNPKRVPKTPPVIQRSQSDSPAQADTPEGALPPIQVKLRDPKLQIEMKEERKIALARKQGEQMLLALVPDLDEKRQEAFRKGLEDKTILPLHFAAYTKDGKPASEGLKQNSLNAAKGYFKFGRKKYQLLRKEGTTWKKSQIDMPETKRELGENVLSSTIPLVIQITPDKKKLLILSGPNHLYAAGVYIKVIEIEKKSADEKELEKVNMIIPHPKVHRDQQPTVLFSGDVLLNREGEFVGITDKAGAFNPEYEWDMEERESTSANPNKDFLEYVHKYHESFRTVLWLTGFNVPFWPEESPKYLAAAKAEPELVAAEKKAVAERAEARRRIDARASIERDPTFGIYIPDPILNTTLPPIKDTDPRHTVPGIIAPDPHLASRSGMYAKKEHDRKDKKEEKGTKGFLPQLGKGKTS